MKERLLRSGISFSFPPIKEMQTACVSLKLLATSHFLSGGVLTPRLLRLETISASVNLLCPPAGSTGFFKNPHHGQIVIRFWRMPGKEEINHIAHRDLIGLRGKVIASLGAASRGDESAPDEQLQDFRRFSF